MENIRTIDELEAAYARNWKSPVNWWDAPANWFDPLKSSSATGGLFTNEINQESSHFRDINMVNVLAQRVLKGNRVFAVVGADHIPMQEVALRCAMK